MTDHERQALRTLTDQRRAEMRRRIREERGPERLGEIIPRLLRSKGIEMGHQPAKGAA